MAISIEFADDAELQARIKVVGVGKFQRLNDTVTPIYLQLMRQ